MEPTIFEISICFYYSRDFIILKADIYTYLELSAKIAPMLRLKTSVLFAYNIFLQQQTGSIPLLVASSTLCVSTALPRTKLLE